MPDTPRALPFTFGGALTFLLIGIIDAGRALSGVDLPPAQALIIIAAVLSLWALCGGLLGLIVAGLGALAFGRGGLSAAIQRLGLRLRDIWRERGRPQDQRRAARALGWMIGVTSWGLGAFFSLRHLIEHRHGAALIAGVALLVQAALALGALLLGLITARLARGAARLPGLGRLMGVAPLLTLSLTVGLLALGLLARRHWATLQDLDGVALSLLGLALLLSPLGIGLTRRRGGAKRTALALTLALITLGLSVQSQEARRALAAEGSAARHLYGHLILMSDWDEDGIPYLPTGADCAPFDPDIRPYAPDVEGDGVDQDCDGRDGPRYAPQIEPAPAPAPAQRDEIQPNLILITIDALRPDHLGVYGYARATSPNIDAFAALALRFDAAYAADSGTAPSMWSLAVGRTPFQAALEDLGRFPPKLGAIEQTLAEGLKGVGYRTEAVLCGAVFADKDWNLSRGFDRYVEVCGKRKRRVAEPTVEAALIQLKALKRRVSKPFYLWVHIYDPHEPNFDHPEIDFGVRKIDLYDEEIRFADEQLAPLLTAATEAGRPTYVILAADHGQNFGEHGHSGHARTLYRNVTRVPLLIRGPGMEAGQIAAPVALNDLYPTLLELAGAAIPARCTMRSQAAVLKAADPGRLIFQENAFARPKRQTRAVISQRHHLIADLTHDFWELYDLEADPGETRNLYGRGVPEEATLKAALSRFLTTSQLPAAYAR